MALVLLALAPAWAAESKPAVPKPTEEDYELQRMLVDTIDQVQRNYVREIPRRKLVEAAIKGILSELDPHSDYIPPDEMERFRTAIESEFGGIGIQVSVDEGQLRVISPMVGTPAYRAGIVAGDRIMEIDGRPTGRITIDEAVRRLKGKEGTQVVLTVIHPGKTAREKIAVTREIIHIDTVLGDHRHADGTWDYYLDRQRRIAHIRVTAFSRETADDLKKVLEQLSKEKVAGLVLDLRFNPGGLLTAAIEVSDLFVAEGRIVSTAGRNSPERVWNAKKEGTFEGFPMVVLVNRYSASASEIVAACLQDHHRATVVGERTYGKGSVQNVIPLAESGHGQDAHPRSALKLTTAGYRRPSGKNIDRAPNAKETDDWGVRPDAGFEVRLDDGEMLSLYAERRQRDIVRPKADAKTDDKPDTEGDRQLQKAFEHLLKVAKPS